MAPVSSGGVIRWLVPTALVLAIVALALVLVPYLTDDGSAGSLVLVEISGDVGVHLSDGRSEQAQPGRVVSPSEQLRTGPSSSAVLAAGADTEIRLSPGTTMTVESVRDDVVSVELEEGRIRADVRGGRRGVRVGNEGRAVQTSDGSVAVAVSDGVVAVEVERGTVTTQGIDGVDRVGAGGGVVVLSDGEVALGPIPDEIVLSVAWPSQTRTRARTAVVAGQTQAGASVLISGGVNPVRTRADASGAFTAEIALAEGLHAVVVEATDAFGRQVSAETRIERDTTPPSIRGGTPVTVPDELP